VNRPLTGMAIEWLSFPKGIGEERECCVEPSAFPGGARRPAVGIYFAGSYPSLRREATCWREPRFSFFRMLVTWWCTVCSEMTSSESIWPLVSPRVTRIATSFSRGVRLGGSFVGGGLLRSGRRKRDGLPL
jgi:hypothetical protein